MFFSAFLQIFGLLFMAGFPCDGRAMNAHNTENVEMVNQRVGYDINLKCGLGGLGKDAIAEKLKINWFFKACGDSPHQRPCHDVKIVEWMQLPCEDNFCKSTLHLRNLTDNYSGLYKCTLFPMKTHNSVLVDIRLVRTYQLQVRNSTVSPPIFLSPFPENTTAAPGSQVVFQCKVQSLAHAAIKWFKRVQQVDDGVEFSLGSDNFNSKVVQYQNRMYEFLEAPREKAISRDVYLSKLILQDVGLSDEGLYACVAINYQGHSIQEVYLQLDSENEYGYDAYTEERTDQQFLLLFLMPVGLALIPLAIWLCYLLSKKCKTPNNNTDEFADQFKALR